MEKAIEAVNSGEMNNSQAATTYSVQRTTLLNRLKKQALGVRVEKPGGVDEEEDREVPA